MESNLILRIHHVLFSSQANGPGKRAVVWLQGCSFRCPGCFNTVLQNPAGGHEMPISMLAENLIAHKTEIEGITVSGGEPIEQIEPLIKLFSIIKKKTQFSVLLFSGHTLEKIQTMDNGANLLSFVDVLVDGPYDKNLANPIGTWPSSANQNIILLTSRYSKTDFHEMPWRDIFIGPSGDIIETGLFGWPGMVPDLEHHGSDRI
jgi:anaerobic ribonucleoside-triphosphate reductase activating protein